ncbi:MAG: phosphotransferase [Candidatus Pacebacteria bacterium]|nr:phosphotransferase [Candidatus Paceibacterota bacterium]
MEKDIELIKKLDKEWGKGPLKIKRAGGQTNRNWTVEFKGKKFFVRLPWERKDIVNRGFEGKNILAITRNRNLKGVVPRFFVYILNKKNILNSAERFDFPDGTMVMEYIDGKDIDGNDLKNQKTQESLIRTLHSFHSSGVRFVNPYDVFRDEVEKYKRQAKEHNLEGLLTKEDVRQIETVEEIAKKKLSFGGKISTHNDLIFENLRLAKNGKVYLIDFEYAGCNMRDGLHYDLGIILGGNLFQKKPMSFRLFERILEKMGKIYGRNLNKETIYWGALVNVMVMLWWGIVKYHSLDSSKGKKYFKEYVLKRVRGIRKLKKILTRNV